MPSESAHLANIHPEFEEAVKKLPPAPPVLSEDLVTCRDNYENMVIPACHALFEGDMPSGELVPP